MKTSLKASAVTAWEGEGLMLWCGRGVGEGGEVQDEVVRGGVRILVNVHRETDPDQNKLYSYGT